jgi:hypothetical protein
MALIENYLVKTTNLATFFNSLLNAQAPTKFTIKFLEQLEFKSPNDRLLIGLLKALNFLDGNGVPTQRYFKFLDQSESKKILAEAIQEAYSDLFTINTKANEMSSSEIKNKLKTITQGSKSDNVLDLMSKTFKALCDYADFTSLSMTNKGITTQPEKKIDEKQVTSIPVKEKDSKNIRGAELHYNIQIHLPESRDQAVYDAIFKSLKEHIF